MEWMWLQPVQSASDLKLEPSLTYLTVKQRKKIRTFQTLNYFVLESLTGILQDKMQKKHKTIQNRGSIEFKT